MAITAPLVPLSASAFKMALSKGQGRVLQHINIEGGEGVEQHLIEACVTCVTYDPQCEGMREDWLFTLVEQARLQARVLKAILDAEQHPSPKDCVWDRAQRSAMLRKMAASGSHEARQGLYATLGAGTDFAGIRSAEDIIELDGIDGLIAVAREAGRQLREDPEFWADDCYIQSCDLEPGAAMARLQREAEHDEDVRRYLAGLSQTAAIQASNSGSSPTQTYSAQQILDHLRAKPADPCHWFRQWGRFAGEVEREQVFSALLSTDDAERAKRLFKCFARNSVPRFDDRLLQWAAHSDEQLRWAAVTGLSPLTHPELRGQALQFIENDDLANGIALLVNNFQQGDFAMIAERLEDADDEVDVHCLVGRVLDLCERNFGAEALDCLMYVYEHSPCSLCRMKAFKALVECRAAPAWVITEAALDVDEDIRALASQVMSTTR